MKPFTALAKLAVVVGLFAFAVTAAQAQVVLTMANSNTTPYELFLNATYSGSLAWIKLGAMHLVAGVASVWAP